MADPRVTAALRGSAKALQSALRMHKREEQHHRRRARAFARQLEQLRLHCEELGIELELVTDTAEEAQS